MNIKSNKAKYSFEIIEDLCKSLNISYVFIASLLEVKLSNLIKWKERGWIPYYREKYAKKIRRLKFLIEKFKKMNLTFMDLKVITKPFLPNKPSLFELIKEDLPIKLMVRYLFRYLEPILLNYYMYLLEKEVKLKNTIIIIEHNKSNPNSYYHLYKIALSKYPRLFKFIDIKNLKPKIDYLDRYCDLIYLTWKQNPTEKETRHIMELKGKYKVIPKIVVKSPQFDLLIRKISQKSE